LQMTLPSMTASAPAAIPASGDAMPKKDEAAPGAPITLPGK
jgi:hypothetical protein